MAFDLLLARSLPLPGGSRVSLRLARPRDGAAIGGLLRSQGHDAGELEVARLVRSDPQRRCVVCATALAAGREVLVGVGAIALGPEASGELELLVVADELGEDLGDLLRGTLVSRALASAA